jgi:nuclear pore complex protein Nup205
MAEITALDALQAFHQGLLSLREGRVEGAEVLGNEFLVQIFETGLGKFWDKPARKGDNRNAVKSGKEMICAKRGIILSNSSPRQGCY